MSRSPELQKMINERNAEMQADEKAKMPPQFRVVAYDTDQELEDELNRLGDAGYYLVMHMPYRRKNVKPYSVIMRYRDQKSDDVTPPQECTIWGGPLSGQNFAMPQALALWGAGLLNKPTGGVANATSAGRKAKKSEWKEVVDSVFEAKQEGLEEEVEFQ